MTPQEKAEELVNKFRPMMYCYVGSEMLTNTFNEQEQIRNAKQCALIVVDEILEELDAECWGLEMDRAFERQRFWLNVKQEIEKL